MLGKFSFILKFFFTLIELAKKLPVVWRERPVLLPELPTSQVEPGAASLAEEHQPMPVTEHQPNLNDHDRFQIHNIVKMQWALLVTGTCFAAISTALQAVQVRASLPPTFAWFCMTCELAFLALLVAVYILRHYHKAARVMEHVAVFFTAVAFLLAILMTLPSPLKQMSIALFFIGFTIIILANRSLHDCC